MNTICAISSGKINSGIGVIRLSGKDSFAIINKLIDKDINTLKPNQATFTKLISNNQLIDEIILIKYVDPKSFTGEDMIEINCHGGVVLMNKIIELLIKNGATLAEPGEFSKRAFINGKINLVKAESINDIIHAQTTEQISVAASGFNNTGVDKITDELLAIIATIEVNIDYPEYDDVEELTSKEIKPKIKNIVEQLNESLNTSKEVLLVNEGVNVAIVGKPNAGKSSLLNALSGSEIAIVTDEEGTTRDVLKSTIAIDGIPHTFYDTAGIRETDNKVEKIGVTKAKETLEKADVVINLIVDEKDIMEIKDKKVIVVQNKIDENKPINNTIGISALNNDVKNLITELKKSTMNVSLDLNDKLYAANSRQYGLLQQALDSLTSALNECENNSTVDLISLDLYDAIKALNKIIGKEYKDGILKEMFGKFCLGK